MLSDTLKQALRAGSFTIREASERAQVERTFLSRLVAGYPPPRTRRGRRLASQDERYRRLAAALGLGEEFLVEVEQAQRGQGRAERDSAGPAGLNQLATLVMSAARPRIPFPLLSDSLSVFQHVVHELASEAGRRRLSDVVDQLHPLDVPPLPATHRTEPSLGDGPSPLWNNEPNEPLARSLVVLGETCFHVEGDIPFQTRADLAGILYRLGTANPNVVRREILGMRESTPQS